MASRKAALTPALIDNLKKDSLLDTLTPGLVIRIAARGRKVWKFYRRLPGTDSAIKQTLGCFPAFTIAEARAWAAELNAQLEAGIDPREAAREEALRSSMTVAKAHALYMEAVREGRGSRAKRKNKPRTISDKQQIYERDIAPKLAKKIIYEVSENDLVKLVQAKGRGAKVRANRLAAELKVFFGWAASLRGTEIGLEQDPSRRLGDLRFPEDARTRKLSLEEIGWFLRAVALEERDFRRGLLLLLLTAARLSEVTQARSEEVVEGIWTIPAGRTKNSSAHRIALGPWGQRLMHSNNEWVFPAELVEGPRTQGWYEARDRVRARMSEIAGYAVEHFVPHDLRRTARSNTKRLKVDYETAEAMMNHLKRGLDRTYDQYELEDEKRAWFLLWESEILGIARQAGVAELLEGPAGAQSEIAAAADATEAQFSARAAPDGRIQSLPTPRRSSRARYRSMLSPRR